MSLASRNAQEMAIPLFTLGDKQPCYLWLKLKYYLLFSKRYMYMEGFVVL